MIASILLLACVSISAPISASDLSHSFEISGTMFHRMKATAYCLKGKTATGCHTRKGICAASSEHFGQLAMVYEDDGGYPGDFIGYFECKDTGGKSVSSGYVIDLWLPTYNECIQFGSKDVLVVWIDGN